MSMMRMPSNGRVIGGAPAAARSGWRSACHANRAKAKPLCLGLAMKDRKPDGRLRRVGPLDAVPPVRRDMQPVAGAEGPDVAFVSKPQPRRAAQQQHPFGFVL